MIIRDSRKKEWSRRKKETISGITSHNEKVVKEFLKDCELGMNMPKGHRGRRAPSTLVKLFGTLGFILRQHSEVKIEDWTKRKLHKLFKDMFEEKIKKVSGKKFRGVDDYVKVTKFFWNWLYRTKKITEDISEDLSRADNKGGKPTWVYLDPEKMKTILEQ